MSLPEPADMLPIKMLGKTTGMRSTIEEPDAWVVRLINC